MKADSPLVDAVSPSPNFGERAGKQANALILHYTGMKTGALARTRLLEPASQVSCHYLVWEDGRIEQLVAETHRAWHAGRSFWAGETDMNSVSIGIEIVNAGHEGGCPPYPKVQIDTVVVLARDICIRNAIVPARVLGHSDIAPARKRDPGEWFPWVRLVEDGIARGAVTTGRKGRSGVGPGAAGSEVMDLQRGLSELGFGCDVTGSFDGATRDVVTAFQRRYRPACIDGAADGETRALLDALR